MQICWICILDSCHRMFLFFKKMVFNCFGILPFFHHGIKVSYIGFPGDLLDRPGPLSFSKAAVVCGLQPSLETTLFVLLMQTFWLSWYSIIIISFSAECLQHIVYSPPWATTTSVTVSLHKFVLKWLPAVTVSEAQRRWGRLTGCRLD